MRKLIEVPNIYFAKPEDREYQVWLTDDGTPWAVLATEGNGSLRTVGYVWHAQRGALPEGEIAAAIDMAKAKHAQSVPHNHTR